MTRSTISINVPYIKTLHKTPYPAISPLRPELNQAGKTVLITGGGTGIGFAIARAFVQASASHVIITGRREKVIADSVSQLKAEADGSKTTVSGFASDMADLQDSEKLWDGFKSAGIAIDVLVLNAASAGEVKPILQAGLDSTWRVFEINVRGLLDYAQRFYRQGGDQQKVSCHVAVDRNLKCDANKWHQYLINVSTSCVHNFTTDSPFIPTYGLTKNSGTLLIQQIAKDTASSDMQIVSFHPGGILSDAAKSVGYDETSLDWDDGKLPAVFCFSLESCLY